MKLIVNIPIRTASIIIFWVGCFLNTSSMEAQILKKLSQVAKEVVKEVENSVNTEIDKEANQWKNFIRCSFNDTNCIENAKEKGKEIVLTEPNGKIMKNQDGSPVIYSEQNVENKTSSSISDATTIPDAASNKIEIKSNTVEAVEVTPVGFNPSPTELVIEGDVWDAKENKIIKPGWVKIEYYGKEKVSRGPYYQIINSPNHFFTKGKDIEPVKGFYLNRFWGVVSKTGGKIIPQEKLEQGSKLAAAEAKSQLYIGRDNRKAVFFVNGDIWRAEYDWFNGMFINEKQVTNKGVFNDKDLLFWYDNAIYIRGEFSQENPIVRIDLISGDITEIPLNGVFNSTLHNVSYSFTNPSGKFLCSPDTELLNCYDAEQRNFFQIPIKPVDYSAVIERNPNNRHLIWLNDDVFATVHQSPGMISRIDLKNKTIVNLLQLPPGAGGLEFKVTPNRKFLDLIARKVNKDGRNFKTERFLVSLSNGEITPFNLSPEIRNGEWISENHYLYGKKEGGLSEVGTWVYSVKSEENKKIGDIAYINSVVAFPALRVAYFSSGQGTPAIYRADISKGIISKIADASDIVLGGGFAPYPIMDPPLNLRIGSGSVWSNISKSSKKSGGVTPDQKNMEEQEPLKTGNKSSEGQFSSNGSQASTGPSNNFESGMVKLLEATKDWNQKDKDAAIRAYHTFNKESIIFDRTCIALEFSKWYKAGKGSFDDLGSAIPEFKHKGEWFQTCLDSQKIRDFARQRSIFYIERHHKDLNGSEPKKEQVITCVEQDLEKYLIEDLNYRIADRANDYVSMLIISCKN